MKSVLTELDRLEIFGINLLEFCFPYNNADVYRERGYKIKGRPYRVLYNYLYGGACRWPVVNPSAWSWWNLPWMRV